MVASEPRARLLAWYQSHKRDLPWRATGDPYAIWVSEVMLQQTRVETVMPYYERFLARFPEVEELAAADADEVLALWSGLGYYRRARQLHRAAREVVARGGLPTTAAALRRLPGVGEYTAAAVASIAFGEVEPTLDGNVVRLTSRLSAEEGDVRRAAVRRRLREVAAGLLEPARPGESNQALMELGATVCRPRAPRCRACPLAEQCGALAAGEPARFPVSGRARPAVRVCGVAALVEDHGRRVLLVRRSEAETVLPGIWEVPWVDARGAAAPAALAARYGGEWRLGASLGVVRHGITWRDLEIEVRPAELRTSGTVAEAAEAGWFDRTALDSVATSSLVRKILRLA